MIDVFLPFEPYSISLPCHRRDRELLQKEIAEIELSITMGNK